MSTALPLCVVLYASWQFVPVQLHAGCGLMAQKTSFSYNRDGVLLAISTPGYLGLK